MRLWQGQLRWTSAFIFALSLFMAGCSGNKVEDAAQEQVRQEIEGLRAENEELPRLRAENQEIQRLRKENQDIHKLRGEYQQLAQLRKENEQLKSQVAKLPALAARLATPAAPDPSAQTPINAPPQPIANLVQAFEEAALALEGQEIKETDKPFEGDRILVDTNAIALLIPEFMSTNSGQYEISGWLKAKGVRLKNYQQFNNLGITNYQVQRAEPASPNQPGKQ